MTLSPEQISGLLSPKPKKAKIEKAPRRPHISTQSGPIRWYDTTFRCTSKGCGSPTTWKLQGIPYCSMHLIGKCNELLMEAGCE